MNDGNNQSIYSDPSPVYSGPPIYSRGEGRGKTLRAVSPCSLFGRASILNPSPYEGSRSFLPLLRRASHFFFPFLRGGPKTGESLLVFLGGVYIAQGCFFSPLIIRKRADKQEIPCSPFVEQARNPLPDADKQFEIPFILIQSIRQGIREISKFGILRRK